MSMKPMAFERKRTVPGMMGDTVSIMTPASNSIHKKSAGLQSRVGKGPGQWRESVR